MAALVVFTATLPKAPEAGVNVAGFTPVPVSAAVSGLFAALVVTVKEVAGTAPRADGVNVTRIVQLALAASVVVHVPPETA